MNKKEILHATLSHLKLPINESHTEDGNYTTTELFDAQRNLKFEFSVRWNDDEPKEMELHILGVEDGNTEFFIKKDI